MWDFARHGVTSSLLNTFLTCREQTRLHYVEGWASKGLSLALEFGTCMHWCLEQSYKNITRVPIKDTDDARKWTKNVVKMYEGEWRHSVKDPSQKVLQQQEMVYGLAEQVLPIYLKRWDGDFSGGKYTYGSDTVKPAKWLSLEEIFEVPYKYPDGLVVPIRGRRDGVFADSRGKVWVFDTKCRSVINHEDALDTLPFDLQQMLYLFVTIEQGHPVVGTMMNIIRRPGQRQLQSETLKTFLERVGKEVAMPKNFDHYFIRYEMAITKDEVMEWKRNSLDPIMADVRAWYEGHAPHYCNHNALITKYGHCSMYLPIVKNEYSQHFKRDKVFAELPEVAI